MSFIAKEFNSFIKENILDKIKLSIFLLIPILLIIGTAISEVGIILLCLIFIYEFRFKIENFLNNKLLYFFLIFYFVLLINLVFSINIENSFLRNFFF